MLHLAHEHPERFRALIGLETAAFTAPYYDLSWLNRPDVHGGMVSAGVVSGLVAPTAPSEGRWETLWHYMQSGPGVFKGDLHFYMIDGDIRDRVDKIDITRCPLSRARAMSKAVIFSCGMDMFLPRATSSADGGASRSRLGFTSAS